MKPLFTRGAALVGVAVAASVLLAACGEKAQSKSARNGDVAPSQGGAAAYTAPGWKPGDAASWDQQIKARAQTQNEYLRTGAH